jgi:hypothetical protein
MSTGGRRVTLKFSNKLPTQRTLVLEPWSGEYLLAPGKTLEVVAEGDTSYPLEVELDEDRIVLYGFDTTDSMLTVFEDGRELKSVAPRDSSSEQTR